jgi:hypothetical protein
VARRIVTLFALLALFLQSFALQTHIHRVMPQPAAGSAQAANMPAPTPLKGQDPLDQAGCRLCQEFAHSGAFVGPAALNLWTGLVFVMAAIVVPPAAIAVAAPPFAWQSRAPPR